MANHAMPANITTSAQSAIGRSSYHTSLVDINFRLAHLPSNTYALHEVPSEGKRWATCISQFILSTSH